jgi:hypothetical protein
MAIDSALYTDKSHPVHLPQKTLAITAACLPQVLTLRAYSDRPASLTRTPACGPERTVEMHPDVLLKKTTPSADERESILTDYSKGGVKRDRRHLAI